MAKSRRWLTNYSEMACLVRKMVAKYCKWDVWLLADSGRWLTMGDGWLSLEDGWLSQGDLWLSKRDGWLSWQRVFQHFCYQYCFCCLSTSHYNRNLLSKTWNKTLFLCKYINPKLKERIFFPDQQNWRSYRKMGKVSSRQTHATVLCNNSYIAGVFLKR